MLCIVYLLYYVNKHQEKKYVFSAIIFLSQLQIKGALVSSNAFTEINCKNRNFF